MVISRSIENGLFYFQVIFIPCTNLILCLVLFDFISYTRYIYYYIYKRNIDMQEEKKNQVAIPRYQQIALEIASRIVKEDYRIGQKIYARSSIAGQYGVSPETARRAICVLADLDIVKTEKGSGVTIQSQKNAINFLNQNSKRQTISSIKEDLLQSISRQKKEMETLNSCLSDLINATEHFRSMNPFMPFEIRITSDCPFLQQSLADMQFWQHTGATVIAIRRNDTILKSPGPYVSLVENDTLYFITQDDSLQRVKDFLYPSEK